MPKIPVSQAPAGPSLDAAVAEARGWQSLVMGSNAFWVTYGENDLWTASGYLSILPDEGWIKEPLPTYGEKGIWNPSTDIAAAWELVEDVRKSGWADFIDELEAGADSIDPFEVFLYLSPLAITRSYLKAKGVEEIDIPD